MEKRRLYMDYAATTPVKPEVLEAMMPYYTTYFGNASSFHQFGREAKEGLVLLSRLGSAQPTLGTGYELDAIAAVALGGVSMNGGRGRIWGTFVGVLIIAVLNNGLNILGVSSYYQDVVKGLSLKIDV